MSQSADQDGVKQEKYSKIFALLNENEQGRHFLDALSSDSKPCNDVSLRSRIFALEQKLASQQSADGLLGKEGAVCQSILVDILREIERDEVRRKAQDISLQQICESLETTASQLKGSGDHSIAGHILSDMAARLAVIRDQNRYCYDAQEEIAGQLTNIQKYFEKKGRGKGSVGEKGNKKAHSKKFI